ncbi:MAG: hypothetical protein GXC70_00995 [Sphingomonadaceae bacterium]|nr:hypothetical protein [Sphingomonadaceae bacterium]
MNRNEDDDVSLDLEGDSDGAPEETAAALKPDEPDLAAEAFGRLEGQIALVRRAVEHLAAERSDVVIPDYSATLSQLSGQLKDMVQRIGTMARQPALTLTPANIAEQIERAAESTRRQDREQLHSARQELRYSTQSLFGIAEQARTRTAQQRALYKIGGICLLAGILLCTILPGTVARSMPANWRWPERLATRTLGQPSIVEAGIHLIRSEDPAEWDAIAEAAKFERDNRDALNRCKQAANKSKAAVSCLMRISS